MAHLDVTATVAPLPAQQGCTAVELLTVTARTTPSGAVVVSVRGEVDMITSPLLLERLLAHLRSTHQLVVDLSGVSLLCAAGLTVLVVVRQTALVTGTWLCVVVRTRPVQRPLMITGLADVLDVHADVTDALPCPRVPPPSSPAGPRLVDPRQPGDLR